MKQDTDRQPGADRDWTGLLVPVTLIAILIVAAALRLPDLDRTSLWYDEAVSWQQSRSDFPSLIALVARDNYPPLHNILLWLTMPLLGDSEIALRLPSALLGLASVWLMVPLGTALAGRGAGLAGATLLALSPFHVWYSTEARMYALMAATGLFFLLALIRVLQRPSALRLALLVLSTALFLYCHVYALLGAASAGAVCAGLALADLLRRRDMKCSHALAAAAAILLGAIAFLPWLVVLMNRARSVAEAGFWIAYPDAAFLKSVAFSLAGSLPLFAVLSALAAAGLLVALVSARVDDNRRRAVLVSTAYTLGPALLAYLYSVLVQPILFDRYLIAAWPGLLLLACAGAAVPLPRAGPALLVTLALWLALPELTFTLKDKIRPDWRQITRDYLDRRSASDALVLYKGFAAPALAYYLRDPAGYHAADTTEDIGTAIGRGATWMLLVHTSEDEARAARTAFGIDDTPPEARRFGWGASGLSLYRLPSAN